MKSVDQMMAESVEHMHGGTIEEFRQHYDPNNVRSRPSLTRPSILPDAPPPGTDRKPLARPKCFEVVDDCVLIRPKNDKDGFSRAQFGKAAWVPSLGKHVIRWPVGDEGLFTHAVWDDERRCTVEVVAPIDYQPIAEACYERLGSDYGGSTLILDTRTQEEIAYDQALEKVPYLVGRIDVPEDPGWLFSLGETIIPKKFAHGWHERLRMHRLGFFGTHGKYSATGDYSEESEWRYSVASQAERNSYSIDHHELPTVLSRFELSETEQANLRPANSWFIEETGLWWGCKTYFAHIATQQRTAGDDNIPGSLTTWCWLSS